jgi:hypothetical protein
MARVPLTILVLLLALTTLPLLAATGLACRACPLRVAHATAAWQAKADAPGAAKVSNGASSQPGRCAGCSCGRRDADDRDDNGQHDSRQRDNGQRDSEQRDSEQRDTGEHDAGQRCCDGPMRCVCGVVQVPVLLTAAGQLALDTAPRAACVLVVDLTLTDPHLRRLKRPPRSR